MKDVAKLAGVSQSTVSRVLNDASTAIPIAAATRERVLEAAETLGYTPNPLARGLRGASTQLLGLIVREIADPFFAQLIDSLTVIARENGYGILLGHARSSSDEALALTDVLDFRHCDGALLLGDVKEHATVFEKIGQTFPKLVVYCSGNPPGNFTVVDVNNYTGVQLALHYLTDLGHRKIAFIEGGWICATQERLEAFHEFFAQRSIEIPPEYVVRVDQNDSAGGYQGLVNVLKVSDPPTAVFASDDAVAIGALKAAYDMGCRVPLDVSIMGFDDIDAARFTIPALTTIRQPIEELARSGVDALLRLLNGQSLVNNDRLILVEPELVVRDSCGPPRKE